MARFRYRVTPSIAAIDQKFADQLVPAAAILNELFEAHPEYGRGLAAKVRIPESAEISAVGEWLTYVMKHFHEVKTDLLHGRLLVIGLAIEAFDVREHLVKTGLLQAIANEIQEPIEDLLTAEARKRWESIYSYWNDPGGAVSMTPTDPPLRKAPERTQNRIPDPPASSAPPASAEEPAPAQGHAAGSADSTTDMHGHSGDDRWGPSVELPIIGELTLSNVEDPSSPASAKGATPSPPAQTAGEETVPAHPDDPAALDTLARRPFARCIANRMDEVWKGRDHRPTRRGAADTGPGGAFMLHLHGPWGSGKSSILNFLRDELQDERRRPEERWVVVEFNAWRHQRIRPPWWALIRNVYAQAARQLPPLRSLWLRVRWWAWRVRADWLPVAAAAALIAVAVLVIGGIVDLSPAPVEPAEPAAGTPAAQRAADAAWKGVEFALKLLTAALAAWGTVFAVSRSLAFGSARAAQAYTELKSDPLGPIVRLFERLTASIRQPVAVFIDDLDRCDGKYVVELLEGVQTLFRTAPVTYVVAADRKWICASFQQGYKDFGDDIGEAGRPLGYLFLDKLFQVSASVPRPAPEVQRAYWSALLRAAGTTDAATLEARRREAEEAAKREVGNRKTTEALEAFVQEAADPVEQEGRRAVAAQRITTPEAQRETQKHLLEGFADLLEPNPRSMKRLVNAYGLHQATHFLEHRQVAPDALARWTLIELRWPLLADHLASHPETLAAVGGGTNPDGVPDALKPLFGDEAVRDVVRGGGAAPLDERTLRQIVGNADAGSPAPAPPSPPLPAPPAATSARS